MSRAFAVHAPPEGFYDERREGDESAPPLLPALPPARPFLRARARAIATDAERAMAALANRSDEALRDAARALGAMLRSGGFRRAFVADALALAAEAARRASEPAPGRETLIAAAAILSGAIAEANVGADPALAAGLAATVAALAGVPVHIVAPGETPAAEDHARLAPLYRRLGLSGARITADLSPKARRAAYRAAIVHAPVRQLVLDYLRDRLALGADRGPLHRRLEHLGGEPARRLALRGLHFAIATEADAILIDGAFSPVSVAAGNAAGDEERLAREALDLADALAPGADYLADAGDGAPALTDRGRDRLAARARDLGPLWAAPARREERVVDALAARHLLRRGEHYRVADGRLDLVPGHGLAPAHARRLRQLLEVREGLAVTAPGDPLARLTHRQFFRRYLRLAGVAATAREAAADFRALYRLPVVAARTPRRPIGRSVFPSSEAREAHLVARIGQLRAAGRRAVVCLRRAEVAERLADLLAAAGIEAARLGPGAPPRPRGGDALPSPLIVHAPGREAAILLARFMDGVPVDALIVAEPPDDRRSARALADCADASATVEIVAALDDDLLAAARATVLGRLAARAVERDRPFATALAFRALAQGQRRIERARARLRRDRRRIETQWADALAFSGPSD